MERRTPHFRMGNHICLGRGDSPRESKPQPNWGELEKKGFCTSGGRVDSRRGRHNPVQKRKGRKVEGGSFQVEGKREIKQTVGSDIKKTGTKNSKGERSVGRRSEKKKLCFREFKNKGKNRRRELVRVGDATKKNQHRITLDARLQGPVEGWTSHLSFRGKTGRVDRCFTKPLKKVV